MSKSDLERIHDFFENELDAIEEKLKANEPKSKSSTYDSILLCKHDFGVCTDDPGALVCYNCGLLDERYRFNAMEVNLSNRVVLRKRNSTAKYSRENYFLKVMTIVSEKLIKKGKPDIFNDKIILIKYFNEQEEVLEKLLPKYNRKNSLKAQYKLYKLLQKCNYDVCKEDFNLLKTKLNKIENDTIMKEVWKILGWEWIDT